MADDNTEELQFADGETIIEEGTRVPAVYFVIEGTVNVTTHDEHGNEVVLAKLERGEIFGEMSLLGDAPSSATVRADGAVVVQKMTRDTFMEEISSPLVRMVMESLFARLRRMNCRFLEAESRTTGSGRDAPEPRADGPPLLTLTGATPEMREAMCNRSHRVEKFPFHFGRSGENEGGIGGFFSLWSNDLSIDDHPPYNVSRKHCLIDKRRKGFVLVDQHSHYGTLVDGVRVGGDSDQEEMVLEPGRHRIQLGTAASPFVVQVDVPAVAG